MAKVILNMLLRYPIIAGVIFGSIITYVIADHGHHDQHHHKHHHVEDDKKPEKSMAGKLTLPNIKDCTNSKYDYLYVLFWFARKWDIIIVCAPKCASIYRRRGVEM